MPPKRSKQAASARAALAWSFRHSYTLEAQSNTQPPTPFQSSKYSECPIPEISPTPPDMPAVVPDDDEAVEEISESVYIHYQLNIVYTQFK
jgi:hypothetical protein